MYSREDTRKAKCRLKKACFLLAAVILPLSALYVLAIVKGWYACMLISALAALCGCLFAGDLILVPRIRYNRFLKEMGKGLRRSVDCVPEYLDEDVQVQDGVRVRSLQVRLPDDGDSRIFYINASKLDFLPEFGKPVRVVSYGRHIVEFMET